jgi:superfamily II DNA or RNA helicase
MTNNKTKASFRKTSDLDLPLLQQALQQVKALKAKLESEQANNSKLLQALQNLEAEQAGNSDLRQALQNVEILKREVQALKDENARLKEQRRKDLAKIAPTSISTATLQSSGIAPSEPAQQSNKSTVSETSQRFPVSKASNSGTPILLTSNQLTPEGKIALFRALFAGRRDAYAVRWENDSTGASGYKPARDHDYASHIYDGKKKRKVCPGCPDLILTDEALKHHLQGKHTVGIYPLLQDDTCSFLAIDLDDKVRNNITQCSEKTPPWQADRPGSKLDSEATNSDQSRRQLPATDAGTWKDDARSLIHAARALNVPAYLERSRSGKGGHLWIFFERPVSAAKARRLGEALITKANQDQDQLSLRSYDRMFPNQDSLPNKGYGNLIALPLQKGPLADGNSAFLDESMIPYPYQWELLRSVRKMQSSSLDDLVKQATRQNALLTVPRPSENEEDDDKVDPWALPPSGQGKKDTTLKPPLPAHVTITLCNLAYVPKDGLTKSQLNRIERIAAFQNPKFYKNQALRLSNYETPRIISCAEEFSEHVGLPRGCLHQLTELLDTSGVNYQIDDQRFTGKKMRAKFKGKLRPEQMKAANELLKNDTGVLVAATAFGKTVLAAYCISKRKVNTLILVHRQQLLRQWKQRLESFLELPANSIGQIGGGKTKPTGIIDVATIQSLRTRDGVEDLVAEYSQVIVDECHVIGAVTFEQVLRQVRAKFVLGLTATPVREDGHHPVVVMQCGPIRYRVHQNDSGIKEYVVFPRTTNTELPSFATDFNTQEILSFLILEENRNKLIIADVLKALTEKRTPLVLTKRKQHLQLLVDMLQDKVKNVLVYRGGLGKKQQSQFAEKLASIPQDEERVVLATGQSIGEGFDDARLDTLFMTMPISSRSSLTQYAGRLHRSNEGKTVVHIYDYVDVEIEALYRMFKKRQVGYKRIGYKMQPLLQNNAH